MPKKGENITKRKDGRYEARYVKERDERGRIKKYGFVYATSYFDVKKRRDEKLKNINQENFYKNLSKNKSFGDSITTWLDTKISIKDSSYTNYYSIIHSKLIPYFSSKDPSKIDRNDIISFTKSLQEDGLSSKRIKDILILLKQFLRDNDIFIKFSMPKVVKRKIVTLKEEEVNIIESNTINTRNIKEFAILLVLFTGLRIGEICALKWKDIDFENKVIHVSKTILRVKDKKEIGKTKIVITSPKSEKSIRDVPIHEYLLSYLKYFKKEDEFFILSENEKFTTTQTYYYFYKNFLNQFSMPKYNFHVLRHTFATRALLNGMDIKTLSEILGHSSIKITLDLYVHITEQQKFVQINKLPILCLSQSK